MNKQLYTMIRILEWLYIGVYIVFFLLAGYQLTLEKKPTPASDIPILSVPLLQSNAKALDTRFVIPASSQYTATASGSFGRSEPFN